MFLADHKLHPQPGEVEGDAGDAAEVEELRFAVGTVIVRHTSLHDLEAIVLSLLHHLDADHAAVAGEGDALEDAAADQAEVAVHVAQAQAEGDLDHVMIDASDQLAIPRIAAKLLVALYHIHAIADLRIEGAQILHIILRVAVGVENPLLAGGGEAGAQRAAVAAIFGMVDDAHAIRVIGGQTAKDAGGVIRTAVVDDDHFVVVGDLFQYIHRHDDHAGDCAAVVIGGEEGADAGWGRRHDRDNSVG